jgi:hypothetical protein
MSDYYIIQCNFLPFSTGLGPKIVTIHLVSICPKTAIFPSPSLVIAKTYSIVLQSKNTVVMFIILPKYGTTITIFMLVPEYSTPQISSIVGILIPVLTFDFVAI